MEFITAFNQKRPVRLCKKTRAFAFESLQGKYGDETMKTLFVSMDNVEKFKNLSPQKQYDLIIIKIASEAPLRICEFECVSGAATLGAAINHFLPGYFNNNPLWYSVSHLTLDFSTVVFKGIDYLEDKIKRKLNEELTKEQKEQLLGMENAIKAMHIWHSRYLGELKKMKPENYELLKNVPFKPATNFKEAVQSIWFTFAFERLCGNWPGIGRIDEILGGFLEKDLQEESITIDEAREFLAGMFIKGCEWIRSDTQRGSGDAQHYQNIVLSGVDAKGNDITNEVTYLVLEIVEELPIGDFPISVRINKNTSQKLLRRVSEVIRHGGGVIAVYNEDLVINSLVKFGYSLEESRRFANDGCWEVQIPGKTYFMYSPFDSLQIFLNETLELDKDSNTVFNTYDELYEKFKTALSDKVEGIYQYSQNTYLYKTSDNNWNWKHSETPCSVVSLLEEGCIDKGRSYFSGGPKYVCFALHIGGAPDVGNSLYAIDMLVFKEKKVSFPKMIEILKENWEGYEDLKEYVSNKYIYYGNDNDEADKYTVNVLNDFANMVSELNGRCPIMFPAGVSTFGRQIEWADSRNAVPFGRKKGEMLSGNTSPTPDTDTEGATATIRSYCKTDFEKFPNGAALDLKLYPSSVHGENGLVALQSLLRGFVSLGGFFMQLDVVNTQILEEAKKHPEKYKTLSVRVSGWNARFVTLNDEWQNMIIEQSSKRL